MKRFIENYTGKEYDVVVIGGGITGASVAYEAASRGLQVALLEKGDFGAATSAATSKLIHGGLRYLKNMELGLVRESLRERKTWCNIAPNWIYPIPFMIPNYQNSQDSRLLLRMGLHLYDMLSYDRKHTWDKNKRLPGHRAINAKQALEQEPNVMPANLSGAVIYYDCLNIFPERTTLAFVKSAAKAGADVANYAEVTEFLYHRGAVNGVKVYDLLTGKQHKVQAGLVVNSAGTWADKVLELGKQSQRHPMKRSEGIHIITPKINQKHAVTMFTNEGRHFMIIPWRGYSLIGTTDKPYEGDPDAYQVSQQSINELLELVNRYYGAGKLTHKDVLYAYGGLRPLVDDQTKEVYESSRKYEIYDNTKDGLNGLITTEGGKYTTSRNLAQKTVELVFKKLKKKAGKSKTAHRFLAGAEIVDIEDFMQQMHHRYPDFSPETVEYLSRNYGTEAETILQNARRNAQLKKQLTHEGEILAEVHYAATLEMAPHLDDIFLRRTGLGTLGYPGAAIIEEAANLAAEINGWNSRRRQEETDRLKNAYKMQQNPVQTD